MPSPRFIFTPIYCDSGELHELQQAGRRDTTRSFGMRSKVCIGWAASAVTPGRRSLEWTSSGRATRTKSLLSLGQTKCHDVSSNEGVVITTPSDQTHSSQGTPSRSCTLCPAATPAHGHRITTCTSHTPPRALNRQPLTTQHLVFGREIAARGPCRSTVGLRRGDRVAGRVSRHCH